MVPMWHWRSILHRLALPVFIASLLSFIFPASVWADCALTSTGNVPLPDLTTHYFGFAGGLYPEGSNIPPVEHTVTGLALAQEVVPLAANGEPDAEHGAIVMMAVGMSNARLEFGRFAAKAEADPAINPRLLIVNTAQNGMVAEAWAPRGSRTWQNANEMLAQSNVTPAQVQVVWVKQTNYASEETFPNFELTLQADLEAIMHNLKFHYPNIKLAYLSSRVRAYTTGGINPEPLAYETGFAVKWLIEQQIEGADDLGLDVAPWLSWGPYLWADGMNERSDGFGWACDDTAGDFTHPSSQGREKIADQLLAFFKTEPTAQPWFLKVAEGAPQIEQAEALPADANAGDTVAFTAEASDPDGIAEYLWTYGDGTFSYAPSGTPNYAALQNPAKSFFLPGEYGVHLTVVDSLGNWATQTIPVVVAPSVMPTVTPTPTATLSPTVTAVPTATATEIPSMTPSATVAPYRLFVPAVQ